MLHRSTATKLSYISEALAHLERMVNNLKECDPCAEDDDTPYAMTLYFEDNKPVALSCHGGSPLEYTIKH